MKIRDFENEYIEIKNINRENGGLEAMKIATFLKVGEILLFENNINLGMIEYIEIINNELFLKTDYGEFILNILSNDIIKFNNIDKVVTAKGSIYDYLDNGKTQRYKKAFDELNEPQDLLVYIPNWEWINENKEDIEKIIKDKNILKRMLITEGLYQQVILEYIHVKGKKIYIIDKNGKALNTNEEVFNARNNGKENVFMSFITGNKSDFYLPVSPLPILGYHTYDMRHFYNEEGLRMREQHIGNKIIEIIKKTD